jgi:hypothetical protein
MIVFRSTIRGKNSKGGDRLQLYVSQENIQLLIDTLAENLTNPKGAKLDIHTSKKESSDGRTFDSTIAFVKGVTEGRGAAPGRFVAKKVEQDSVDAKIQSLKAKQVS